MPSFSASSIVAETAVVDEVARPPVRLLLLTDTALSNTGGSERFLRNLVSGLPADRYDISVVQLGAENAPDLETYVADSGARIRVLNHPIGAIYGLRALRVIRRLRARLRMEDFDIIQSQHEKSDLINILMAPRSAALRVSNRRDMGFLKNQRLRTVFRFVNHRYDTVVAPAHEILSALAAHEGLPPSRMLWIANGVDTERFRPALDNQRDTLRHALGLARDEIAFGCVASLYPVKDHSTLLRAFARVHAGNAKTRLLLVGSGALATPLSEQARSLGIETAVQLLGNRSDINQILPALDAAVLASRSEGMSNAILEAMACGLPMVATAVGGNLQLVRDGDTGFLVPVGDDVVMAEAMLRLVASADLRARLGAAARRRIECEFSIDGMVNAYDRLYQRLMASR